MSYVDMGVPGIRKGLQSGEFSARELTDAAFAKIDACEDKIHAFIELTPELAYGAADKLDMRIANGEQLGPLAGVPMGFKDNMNQMGTHTTCASRMLKDYISPFDATCVADCLAAGAIPLGKTNMDEFAMGSSTETSYFGPTRNPWDTRCVPGGSSGGSAAAVSAGMATLALGSDTGGSIRQPASFCGVVGLKPSYGVVSRYGVVAFGSSLDQVGPFGRSVEDVAWCMNAISKHDTLDSTSWNEEVDFTSGLDKGVDGLRIGVVPALLEMEGMTQEVRDAYLASVRKLEELGATLVEVELPHVPEAISAYYVLAPCEAFSNLSRFDSVRYGHRSAASNLEECYERSRAEGFGDEVKRRIMFGGYLLASGVYDKYYYPAQQVRTLITNDYTEAFKKVDALIMPTSPCAAFEAGAVSDPSTMYLFDVFTISLNIAGNGGMNLPVAMGADSGLPVGVQIVGPQFKDEIILQVGAALEASCDMRGKIASCGEMQR